MTSTRKCQCDSRYLSPHGVPEDPCGFGDTSEGCPVHDPNYYDDSED